MLSIDEAIAHAREVAKEQRKDNENCKYKSKYGCKGCADYYSKPCIECAEEHEQLAEWLTELKCYKNDNDFSDYADRLHKIAFNSGYNKAIDDFAGRLIRYVDCGHLCSPTEVRWSDLSVVEMIKKLAEQLKAGDKKNDL